MKKKLSRASRRLVSNPGPHAAVPNNSIDQDRELWLHARSFHAAAKKLAGTLEFGSGAMPDFDAGPVVFMYRHALELHLKAIVLGDGGNFLATRPDVLSICKTHAISWLAQFACQIVSAADLEHALKCVGVQNLAEFKAVVEKLNDVDPGSNIFRLPVKVKGNRQLASSVREFAGQMDALLELLDATADALAATWDMQTGVEGIDSAADERGDYSPTIH